MDMRGTAGDYEVGPGDEVSTRVPDRHDSDLTARSQTVRDRLGDCVRVAEEGLVDDECLHPVTPCEAEVEAA